MDDRDWMKTLKYAEMNPEHLREELVKRDAELTRIRQERNEAYDAGWASHDRMMRRPLSA